MVAGDNMHLMVGQEGGRFLGVEGYLVQDLEGTAREICEEKGRGVEVGVAGQFV